MKPRFLIHYGLTPPSIILIFLNICQFVFLLAVAQEVTPLVLCQQHLNLPTLELLPIQLAYNFQRALLVVHFNKSEALGSVADGVDGDVDVHDFPVRGDERLEVLSLHVSEQVANEKASSFLLVHEKIYFGFNF